jgi:SAM-dependent methyltransferase
VPWDFLPDSYDAVASVYEGRFSAELGGKPRDRELLHAFSGLVSDPVVEIGCGPGQIGLFVRQRGRHVIGVDLSNEMAKLANARLGAAVVADMRALPLAPGRVAGLVAFYSLIHLHRSELGTALSEFHRVLRPGGRVIMTAHEGHGDVELDEFLGVPVPFAATLFALDELVDASLAAGLVVTVAERRAPYSSESTFRLSVVAERPATPIR